MNKESERALDNKCPACGGVLIFKPKLNKWLCEYCKSEFDLETLKKYNNASSDENNSASVSKEETKEEGTYVSYRCKNCGAEIVADENTASTFCIYCGNTAILKSKLSGKFAPSKIILFKKEKEDAIEAFKSLRKGRPLMPKFFDDEKNIEKVSGVYIPFWLYDLNVYGQMDATGKIITSWRVGDIQYTKTDTYRIAREGDIKYKKIPVDGSTRFPDDIMNTIEPFDYNEMIEYNHAYLSGFLAEKYDVDSEKSFKIAESRAQISTENEMYRDMGTYTTKKVTSKNFNATKEKEEYVLLPVWMVNVKYNNKYYTFAQNAQTGEFVGNIPIDIKRTILYSILIFVGCFGLIMLIAYLLFKGGII